MLGEAWGACWERVGGKLGESGGHAKRVPREHSGEGQGVGGMMGEGQGRAEA